MHKKVAEAHQSTVVQLDVRRLPRIVPGRAERPIVRIHLLGSMRATTYLGHDVLPRGKKTRAVLGYLCLAPGASASRTRLAALLWSDATDAQARASLRQALRELSSAIGPLANELIIANHETVKLNADACWIDAVAALTPEPPPFHLWWSDLSALCSGELLEELDGTSASFDQWLLGERTRFAERMRALLEGELQQMEASNADASQLASTARRLICFNPAHEGASRVLMRALADLGERGQALQEYARCRKALKKILDVEPSSQTRALHDAIRVFSGPDEPGAPTNPFATSLRQHSSLPASNRNRLRVGVLPFLGNRSTNERDLAFSISHEIAAGLARFRWFDVIAPVSLTREPSGSLIAEHPLYRDDLDYVVDGVIVGNGKHFQVDVRLLDLAEYARPVWSDRFKLAVGELHRLHELVTARIVARIDPVILFIEGTPRRREHYGATGLLLLAIPLIFSMERAKYEEAGRLIGRALELDPDNAMVAAWAAHWHLFYVGQGWTRDTDLEFAAARRHALRAIRLDPDNAEALGIYAHICSYADKDFDSALHYFDRSLRLNPSLAFIWALSVPTYCYIGEPEIALQRLQRYRDLAPFDPYFSWFEIFYMIVYAFKGDYEQAVNVGRRTVKVNPDFVAGYKPLIASLGHLGRCEEAKGYIDKLLSLEPSFTVERFGEVYPFKKASDRERYMAGLRLAGVPER